MEPCCQQNTKRHQEHLTTAPRRQAANGGVRESLLAFWLRLWPRADELRGSQLLRGSQHLAQLARTFLKFADRIRDSIHARSVA